MFPMTATCLSMINFNFNSAEGIFSYIAVGATILAIFVTVFSFLFDGDGGDVDGADGDLGTLSIRSVLGFFLGFGWGGLICLDNGLPLVTSVAIGFGIGLLMFITIAAIMRFIYSLKSDGTLNYETLVGMTAIVYVTIPPNRESGGQVKVAHPSQLFHLPAIQTGDTPLPVNTPVTVTSVTSGILTVTPN